MSSIVESLIGLFVALIIVYVGFVVLYSINPLLAILFVLMGIYVVFRALGGR